MHDNLDSDFRHFLSYSGLSDSTEREINNMRLAFAAGYDPVAQTQSSADQKRCDCENKNLTFCRDGVYICGFCNRERS